MSPTSLIRTTLVGATFVSCPLLACDSTPEESSDAGMTDTGTYDAGANDCPLTCQTFDLAASSYDDTTHVLTIRSQAAVRSGAITFLTAKAGSGTQSHSAVLTVSGQDLSINLSQWLTSDVIFFGGLSFTLVGGCGSTSNIANLIPVTSSGPSGLEITSLRCE